MLTDDLGAFLLGLTDRHVAAESEGAGRVVDGDQALPLLDREGFARIDAEAHCFTLGVKGVEVDVGYYAEGASRRAGGEGREVLVGEF